MKNGFYVGAALFMLAASTGFAQDAAAPAAPVAPTDQAATSAEQAVVPAEQVVAPTEQAAAPAAPVDPSAISDGKTVKFEYTLKVDGAFVESSDGKEPLEYVQGQKMIVPGLEKELAGMKVGESKHVVVKADEGYGAVIPEMIMDLPKTKLAENVVPQKDMMLQFPTKDGGMVVGKVVDLMENDIKVDFNHPLAGKDLEFDIKIVEVK